MVSGLICSFFLLLSPGCVQTLPHESNQFVLRSELPLFAGAYFLNQPFHPISLALADVPKLNYKCSPHDDFRICIFTSGLVEISWRLCRFCVALLGSYPPSDATRICCKCRCATQLANAFTRLS